ncbi:MAG: TIGR01459 family HAD-type hydrolase [Rhodospirillaceae bacterium]|nr:TIGR01459 family HAD-type hydrolase [Rhodospirillaceae bacterium]
MRSIAGLREVVGEFDGFILDLWGLVHDGATAYPSSAATFRALKAANKKTLLLSNAPRRAYALVGAMEKMGLPRDLYGEVLSSGEATRAALIARADPFFVKLGKTAYHLGPERDRSIFDDTNLVIASKVTDADFIVNTGPDGLDDVVEDYAEVLGAGAAKKLPMVCANPDMVVIRGGERIICAGAIAKKYEALGGTVAYRGKPDPAVYELAVKQLGLPKDRIAVVGDALETDVKGANAAELKAIWCTGGIHAEALGVRYGEAADPKKAAALAEKEGNVPAMSIPGFVW